VRGLPAGKAGSTPCLSRRFNGLYGTYANWFVTSLAAALGTAALSPVTAAGHAGLPWQESLITAAFLSVGLGIIAAVALALWGLRARAQA
jgi:hydroxylaminobenzene mutase